MQVKQFIEQCEYWGYPCDIDSKGITIYRMYGHKLRDRMRIGWVSLVAANHFKLSLDPSSERDGIGDMIIKFGTTSIKNRGRLSMMSFRHNNSV